MQKGQRNGKNRLLLLLPCGHKKQAGEEAPSHFCVSAKGQKNKMARIDTKKWAGLWNITYQCTG